MTTSLTELTVPSGPRGANLVELQEWMGSDRGIALAAWTSTYDHDRAEDFPELKVNDLVRRCIREGHTTPIESVVFRFWCRIPIFTDRQHVTHRIATHNGLSGRYRTLPADWFPVPDDVREIAESVQHGYGEQLVKGYNGLMQDQQAWYRQWLAVMRNAEKAGRITNAAYKRFREIVRGVIGTSTMTERTSLMNLHSFTNYQRRRNDKHAQKEIRDVAQEMLTLVEAAKVAPVAIETLKEVGWRLG